MPHLLCVLRFLTHPKSEKSKSTLMRQGKKLGQPSFDQL